MSDDHARIIVGRQLFSTALYLHVSISYEGQVFRLSMFQNISLDLNWHGDRKRKESKLIDYARDMINKDVDRNDCSI